MKLTECMENTTATEQTEDEEEKKTEAEDKKEVAAASNPLLFPEALTEPDKAL